MLKLKLKRKDMKKQRILLLATVIMIVLLLNSCGGLFMTDDARNLVGFWSSESWNTYEGEEYPETCYYDFRDDGKVFVTDYTYAMPFYNYWPIPVYFKYTVSDGQLTMSQYLGIVKFEFNTDSDLSSDSILLTVYTATGDYEKLDSIGNTITLTRVIDYSEQDLAARAFLEGYGNE
jgi:hypothetical protein